MEIILVFGVKLWNWACPHMPGSDFVRVLTICRMMSSLGPQTCRKQQRRLTAVTPRKWRFSRSEGTLYKDMSFSRHLADMCLTLYLVWQSKKKNWVQKSWIHPRPLMTNLYWDYNKPSICSKGEWNLGLNLSSHQQNQVPWSEIF